MECWSADMELSLVVPPLPPGLLPDVKPQDFNLYKQRFAGRLARFEAARHSQFVPRVDSEDFIPGMRPSQIQLQSSANCGNPTLDLPELQQRRGTCIKILRTPPR